MSPDFLRYWRQLWQLIYKPAFRAQLQSALIKWSLIIVKGLVGQQAQLCLPVPSLLCTSQTLQTTKQTLTKCMCVLESVTHCVCVCVGGCSSVRQSRMKKKAYSECPYCRIHLYVCFRTQMHNVYTTFHKHTVWLWPPEGAAFACSFNLLLCLHQLLLMTVLCPTKPTID